MAAPRCGLSRPRLPRHGRGDRPVVPIGAWVLEEARRAPVEWRRAMTDPDGFRLSINLSGRQLVHADLADLVADVLHRVGLNPDALCVEITETVLMEDIEAGVSAVKALKALGVPRQHRRLRDRPLRVGLPAHFPVDDGRSTARSSSGSAPSPRMRRSCPRS